MSNNYIPESDGGAASNGSSFNSRRDIRANNMTGALPVLGPISIERTYQGTFNFEEMLASLHEQFEQDRQLASQPNATRCGICYLHFTLNDLIYRDEGFYTCGNCAQALGQQKISMLRKQQKM